MCTTPRLSKHTERYGDGVSTRVVTCSCSTRPIGWVEWPTKGGDATARNWKGPHVLGTGATPREAMDAATWA